MIITTGYGYYVKDGLKVGKYQLPLGEHPNPRGISFVEVADKQALDKIVLDAAPISDEEKAKNDQILLDKQIQQKRNEFVDALMEGKVAAQSLISSDFLVLKEQKASLNK